MRQLLEPALAVGGGEDGRAGGKEPPVLEEGFDLEFEPGLAANGLIISLGGAFEQQPGGVGGLPDRFEFIEPEQSGQGKGIAAVLLVGLGADEAIVPGITDDDLLDVGTEELGDPAGEIGFFEHEAFVTGRNGLDVLNQSVWLGAKAPPLAFAALVIEMSEETILRVGIEAQPCYRGRVSHNEPFNVND